MSKKSMTLPSRRPRPLGSASAPGCQGGQQDQGHEFRRTAPGQAELAVLDQQVLAELADAAQHGRPAPGRRLLAQRLGRTPSAVRCSLDRLERAGCVRRFQSAGRACYEILSLSLSTTAPAPPPARLSVPYQPRPVGVFTSRTNLTPNQRRALSAALRLIGGHGVAAVADVASGLGWDRTYTRKQLAAVATRGHLLQRDDGHFVATIPGKAAAEPRIEIRDGIKVTIYPPMLADGALLYRPMLGRGVGRRS